MQREKVSFYEHFKAIKDLRVLIHSKYSLGNKDIKYFMFTMISINVKSLIIIIKIITNLQNCCVNTT